MRTFEQSKIAFTKVAASVAPSSLTQPVDNVPGAAGYAVRPPLVKLSSKAKKREMKKSSTLLSFWLNVPLVDGLVTVSKLYKIISTMAFNYQADHQDAFFEQYPQLMLRSDEEISAEPDLSTSYIRKNYRLFSKRLAHYYYHYCEAKKFQLAALLNIAVIGKLNGNDRVRELASDCKMSNINTNCNLYQRFPQPSGLENYMVPLMGYATGSDTMGNDLVAIPLWRTEVFGNVLEHDQPLNAFYIADENGKPTMLSPTEVATNYPGAQSLMVNMARTAELYGFSVDAGNPADTPLGVYEPPTMPVILNGSVDAVSDGQNAAVVPVNLSGHQITDKAPKPASSSITSDLTAKLWNNYFSISRYMESAFPEMLHENSDFRAFAEGSLKIVEKSADAGTLAWSVRKVPNTSIVDITNRLTYSKDGKMNTATIIKYAPMFFSNSATRTSFFKGGSEFKANFDRYPVDSDDPVAIIKEAKKWPHLNPTLFGSADKTIPLVMNATSSISREYATVTGTGLINYPVANFAGKFASYFDFARSCGIATDQTQIDLLGVTPDYAKDIIQAPTNENAVVFNEVPDSVFVLAQDPFDPSDIAQAGFNLLLSYNNPSPSDWEEYELSPSLAKNGTNIEPQTTGTRQLTEPIKTTLFDDNITVVVDEPIFGFTAPGEADDHSKSAYRAHSVSNIFLDKVKHAFVFVGIGIFNHPIISASLASSGFYKTDVFSPVQTDAALAAAAIKEFYFGEHAFAKVWQRMHIEATMPNQALYDVGKSAEIVGSSNPEVSLMSIVKATDQFTLNRYTFNPYYGPVQPALPPSLFGERSHILLTKDDPNGDQSPIESWDTIDPIDYGKGYFGLSGTKTIETDVKLPVLYDQMQSPMVNAFEQLGDFTFPSVSVDNYGTISIKENAATVRSYCPAKAVLALASHVSVQYAGVEHTKAFWSVQDMVKLNQYSTPPANGVMPEDNVIAETRAPSSQGRPGSSNNYASGKYDNRSDASASIGSSCKGGDGNNTSAKTRRSSGRDKKRTTWRNRTDDKINRDGVNSDGIIDPKLLDNTNRASAGIATQAFGGPDAKLNKKMNDVYNS